MPCKNNQSVPYDSKLVLVKLKMPFCKNDFDWSERDQSVFTDQAHKSFHKKDLLEVRKNLIQSRIL